MALQLAARRGLTHSLQNKAAPSLLGSTSTLVNRRWQSSKDAGDVIGIDLGTTNSCVSVMVSALSWKPTAY